MSVESKYYIKTCFSVPSPPLDIKAVMSATNKILVSWLPPKNSNGQLVGYTFYMSVIEDGREEGTHKRILSPTTEYHETMKLQESATYQFWVTASTRVGEGKSSRVVSLPPSSTVPAKIVSFSREIVTAWKETIELPCRRVGIPTPVSTWKQQEKAIDLTGRKEILTDGTLVIRDTQKSDHGNYTCSVENQHGRDDIMYVIRVRVPPDPPILTVVDSYADSLHLHWQDQKHGGSPILGYVINYQRDHGDWEELQMNSRSDSHMLRNLWCGTRYQLYITAYNKIGTGLPCDIVNAYTKGTVPVKPKPSQMLTMNATVVTIWLDSWGDGGCGISYFIIEYRESESSQWVLSSNNVKPTERVYSVMSLTPATEYHLRVTAHNNAGSTIAFYNFTTLTIQGILPDLQSPVQHTDKPFYANIKVWIPITTSLIILGVLIGSVAWIRRRSKYH